MGPEPALRTPDRGSAWLAFSRKLLLSLLGVGAIGAVVGGGTIGTAAKFTATSVNPSNTFAAGTLTMTNSGSGSCVGILASACGTVAITSAGTATIIATGVSNLLPGNAVSGSLIITNAGSLPAKVTVAFANLSGSANSNASQCLSSTTGLGTCTNLTQTLNLTLHDDSCTGCSGATTNYCLYGRNAGNPGSGACDTLTGAASQNSADAIQSAPATGVQVPGSLTGSSNMWAGGEAHTFTLTLQMPSGVSNIYQGGSASFDLVWLASQS